ncbi:MAG: DNA mismatch repair protein MutS [Flavobacteriales bacterium]|nr:DNA mismatch repair protein MutS [Flavobacteriales bacterium]
MPGIDEQTIQDLEFHRIREMLVELAVGPTSQKNFGLLTPMNRFRSAHVRLEEVKEFLDIRNEQGAGFPRLEFEEVQKDLKRLKMKNASLFLEGIIRVYRASLLCNELLQFFKPRKESSPRLYALSQETWYTKDIIKPVDKVLDKRFKVKDDASERLMKIRQEVKRKRAQVNRNFDRLVKKYAARGFLGESLESFLNERRVLSVVSSHKRSVAGSSLGGSRSGQVTYVEPQENVALNFELDQLGHDEQKEIERILQELSETIREQTELVKSYQKVLTRFDDINARCRLALKLQCELPGLVDEPYLELVQAYHPLLWLSNQEKGVKTEPQSLLMDEGGRMLVISGPNAGGKSITLKTIGLLQLMLQSGLLVPVDANSRMGWFHKILSDIGDNQSIENQLSTYSYRLKRMKFFLDQADEHSLLLLDEFGTGSDPELGGALAEVFFERLYEKGAYGVITTHYANIKLKAAELPFAFNASMLFNTETLEPRYKLSIGQPGSSFTFEVAQMNGIPKRLIESAKGRLDHKKVELDKLIAELQQEKAEFEDENQRMRKAQRSAKDAEDDMRQRQSRYEERLQTQQKRIERNNKYLNSGKKMHQFIDAYTLGRANKELLNEVKKFLTIEKTKLEEARKLKDRKEKSAAKSRARKERERRRKNKVKKPVKVGSTVRLEKSNQRGEVIELKGSEAVVMFGSFKTKVGLEKLVVV